MPSPWKTTDRMPRNNTMKKELAEFEKAFENNDSINLTSKSDLKLSIEEKKREIFDTENILSFSI